MPPGAAGRFFFALVGHSVRCLTPHPLQDSEHTGGARPQQAPGSMTWPVGFLFTPQQLQGSMKYSSGVRLGNWREDDALDDLRLMDYVHARENGNLALTARREMRKPQIAPRTLSTPSSDGIVRNGDLLQLTHLSGALPQRSSSTAAPTLAQTPQPPAPSMALHPLLHHPHTPTPPLLFRRRDRGQHGSAAQGA